MLIAAIAGLLIFGWLTVKQYNRRADRHNRMVDKQEELLQLLRDKETANKQDNTQQNEN